MQESLPIRVAWFTAAAALVATFTLMGVWTVRMALADYRFRQETLPGTQEALRLEPDSAGYYVRLAAIIQESNPVASTEALQPRRFSCRLGESSNDGNGSNESNDSSVHCSIRRRRDLLR